jgi:hypothetical protein
LSLTSLDSALVLLALGCLLAASGNRAVMPIKSLVGDWDVHFVPTGSVVALVAADQEDCLSCHVESEKDPNLSPTR